MKKTSAQVNYEFWLNMCNILKKDPCSYKPLIDSTKKLEQEQGYELKNKPKCKEKNES